MLANLIVYFYRLHSTIVQFERCVFKQRYLDNILDHKTNRSKSCAMTINKSKDLLHFSHRRIVHLEHLQIFLVPEMNMI